MPSIKVLLSAYNGADFITAQLESLLAQTHPDVSILVRDDGSQDGTKAILQAYADEAKLAWIEGDNLGIIQSFMALLGDADTEEYYAFCDQDDVWLPDKLHRAIDKMSPFPPSTPLLYFTQTNLVDNNLNPLNRVFPHIKRPVGFGHALVQNVVTGCTMVINQSARELILSAEPNWNDIRMHDWWMYLVIAGHGQVIFDPLPSVNYRQHGANQVGANNLLEHRWARFSRRDANITRQAKAFYQCYRDTLPDHNRKLLEDFLAKDGSLLKRIQLMFNDNIYRQKRTDDLILKVLLLLNRL